MNSTLTTAPIESIEEFLAHASMLELESVERYEELADAMDVHNNPEVAKLFRKLAHFGEKHAAEVSDLAKGVTLPDLPPWEFKWMTPESPESGLIEEAHYLMDSHQALNMALHNEQRGRDFYAMVAETSSSPEVRDLAQQFTNEEQEHLDLLKEWKENLGKQERRSQEDLDPPNIPE